MQITDIKIQNFQSHVDTNISFTEGLNVFVGRTNSGKSAIFRAFQKIFRNTPAGTNFITKDQTSCMISLNKDHVKRFIEIKKNKDGSSTTVTNKMLLVDKPFDKIGRDLPPDELFNSFEISKPITIGGLTEDFNFISQRDTSFLVSKQYTPSTVAQFFDRLTGVGILNKCLQEAKTRQLHNQKEIKNLQQQQQVLQEQVTKFYYVKILEDLYKVSEQFEIKNNELIKISNLANRLAEINSQKRELSALETSLQTVQQYQSIQKKYFKIFYLHQLDGNIANIRVFDISSYIAQLNKLICLYNYINIESKIVKQDFPDLINFTERFRCIYKIYNLVKLEEIYTTDIAELLGINEEMKELNQQKDQLLHEMKICPLCGSKL